jgi:diguanylate cyclase (GGDEF)-like protein/PAS domain S-box-containing protein
MTASILIVDDELPNRRLLEALLRPEGYVTRTASDGVEALRMIREDPPDLVLLDVMMPGMDGHQVANEIKADPLTCNIPIVMVTARTDREARLTALDAGAEEFLTKPVDRAELWLRVRNLLRLKSITDFLQNHRQLLEAEVQVRTADLQRFRTAMDASGDAIFLIERTTMAFVEVNTTACRMLGYERDELLALSPIDLQADSLRHVEELYQAVIAGTDATTSIEVIRRKDGTELPVEAHRHAQGAGDDSIIVMVLRDITERRASEARLQHLAHYDALTGLPNRTLFHDTLEQALPLALSRGWTVAVLFIDLDHFKNVNDTLGHTVGDTLLVQFSQRLTQCVRIRDTVGRLGGDEFALILTMEDGPQGAAAVATKIQESLREPFDLDGHELTVTASIGITTFPDDTLDRDTLVKYADTAMYQAKHAGRDTFRFFTTRMNSEALARLELEIALRSAVKNQEFVLHYQPKVHLDRGTVTGLEALLRWDRPGTGLVPPGDFIPVLEDCGLIVEVGRWVVNAVCEQIANWMLTPIGPMQVSVNVSGRQFVEGDLEGDVLEALHVNEIPPELLELELTESSLMANTSRTIAILENLKGQGVHISIDDFGTGYSSLAYLRRFPIDKLKIDISFVRDITTSPDDAAIAVAIIQMAHSLNLDVIAEGVETAAQREYLRRHRCDQMQGYYFSPPLPVAALEHMLLAGTSLPTTEDGHALSSDTLLLVDEDPDILEALQLLLLEDGYHILQAATAADGLELLALHDVQVLLCEPPPTGPDEDADFLDRVKELHPHTLRIVLSDGDEAALIGTINRGEIHRYYKKPWEDLALREDLRAAFRHYWRLHRSPPGGTGRFEVPAASDDGPVQHHDVHLWSSTDDVVDAIAGYWQAGIEAGEDFLLIALPAHRAAALARLEGAGVDSGLTHHTWLDTQSVAESVLVNGIVDPVSFDAVLGAQVRRLTGGGRRLRVYGELVGRLWDAGAVTESLRLEVLWNELAGQTPFSMLCGYRVTDPGPGGLITAVCGLHHHVLGGQPSTATRRNGSTPLVAPIPVIGPG